MRFRWSTAVVLATFVVAFSRTLASGAENEIRVLFLSPREAGLAPRAAVSEFEHQIRALGGQLVVVGELAKAEVLVEFATFKSGTSKTGEPELRWEGHFLPLVAPPQASHAALARAEPFTIVMTGPDESSKQKAAVALGRMLAEVLGREKRPAPGTI